MTQTRPVLGVIACNRSVENQSAQVVMTRYLHSALRYADASALLVPAMPDLMHAGEVAPRLDGLLLTGTPSNLDPKRYGVLVDDAPGPFDPARDEMTAHLIESMLDLGKPVFGICRGFQELNVAFGGTLRRDMAENPDLIRTTRRTTKVSINSSSTSTRSSSPKAASCIAPTTRTSSTSSASIIRASISWAPASVSKRARPMASSKRFQRR